VANSLSSCSLKSTISMLSSSPLSLSLFMRSMEPEIRAFPRANSNAFSVSSIRLNSLENLST